MSRGEAQIVSARKRLARFIGQPVESEFRRLDVRSALGTLLFRMAPFVVLELAAVWIFLTQAPWFGENFEAGVVLLHSVASLALAIALHPFLPLAYQECRTLSGSLIFGLSMSLPVFGPACVIIILSLIRKSRKCVATRNREPWVIGSRVPDAELTDYSSGRDSADSILQIMVGSDPIARRNLILATKRLSSDQAIPVLRTGLRDSDEETKLYSQAILSQIEEKYEKTIADLKAQCEQKPQETACRLRLAEQYHEIVDLDLVTDSELQDFYIRNAIKLLMEVVNEEPRHEQAHIDLVRYHLRIGESREASVWLGRLRELNVSNEVLEVYEVEILFNQRAWERLRSRIREGMRNRFCDPALQAAGEFWFPQNRGRRARSVQLRERYAG